VFEVEANGLLATQCGDRAAEFLDPGSNEFAVDGERRHRKVTGIVDA
jgi:hypothetical protein